MAAWIYYNQASLDSEQTIFALTHSSTGLIGAITPSGSDLFITTQGDVSLSSGLTLAQFYNQWHYIVCYIYNSKVGFAVNGVYHQSHPNY